MDLTLVYERIRDLFPYLIHSALQMWMKYQLWRILKGETDGSVLKQCLNPGIFL